MFTIKTKRLVLRDLVPEDWKLFSELMAEPETRYYMKGYLKAETEEAAKEWVKEMMIYNAESPRHSYNLILELNGKPVGWIGIGEALNEEKKDLDFSYALKKEFWGQGLMAETLEAILKFCFENLPVKRITGECETKNLASQRVMKKSGMTLAKKFTAKDKYTGEEKEKFRFYITKNNKDQNQKDSDQEKTHLKGYARIKYGNEKTDWQADKYECHDCGAMKGQLHRFGCDVEECPICDGQIISCGHFKELLPKFRVISFGFQYYLPAKKEYFIKFLKITCTKDGKPLILFSRDQQEKWVVYCDKVLVGEKLKDAVKRILDSTFGISEAYTILVENEKEQAKNKHGEILDRVVVEVDVKYTKMASDIWPHYVTEWIDLVEFGKRLSEYRAQTKS